MVLAELTKKEIAYIILIATVFLVLLGALVYSYFLKRYVSKNFKKYYYRKIYATVMDKDYYLINNYSFRIDSSNYGEVDHLMFGQKYIYVICDYHYEGDLSGKESDPSLVFHAHNGDRNWTSNPLIAMKNLINQLSFSMDFDPSLFIGLCLVNNDCGIGVQFESKQTYLVNRKSFKKLVKSIESRKVSDLNQDQLEQVVIAINHKNITKKR